MELTRNGVSQSTTQNTRLTSLQSEETNLKREIGLFSGINVLVGIMVGSGIFYLGSYVLMRSGMSMGLALLVWLLGGIVTLISGLCYAELGAMMPKAGGSYLYLREAYGNGMSFTSGFSGFVLGSCGSTAALAIALPTAISNLVPLGDFQIKIIAVIAVVLLTIANIYGVKQGAGIQNFFTVGKLIPITAILLAGLFWGKETPNLSLTPQNATDVSISNIIGMVAFGVVATLWAYEGWKNLNVISEEIKNPKKNIPLAIILSILFVTVLYTAFNYAIYKVVPAEKVTELIATGNYFLGTEAAKILFGDIGGIIVGTCMVVSVFGALNGCVLVFPRSCMAIARDGYLPKKFATVHKKHQTPHIALIVHMIISILLIFSRDLNQITSLVTFSGLLFGSLTFYSVIKLRKKYPDMPRPYRVNTLIVYLSIAVMIGLLINTLNEDLVTSLIGLGTTAIVALMYVLIGKKVSNNEAK